MSVVVMVFRKLLPLSFWLQPCMEWFWYNKRVLSIGSLIRLPIESILLLYQNHSIHGCKTEFLLCALLLLLATLHCKQKHYLCFSLNRHSLKLYTECMSTAEKDIHGLLDYWSRASFPCSRVILFLVPGSFVLTGGWKPILDTHITNITVHLFLLCKLSIYM